MKVFDHPNMANFRCPICDTSDDKPVVLIAIDGTTQDRKAQARQYHLECVELTEFDTSIGRIIAQTVGKE